jgi:hypothetical protein
MAKEKQPDSLTHHEDRRAKMQQEAAVQHQQDAEAETKRELTQADRERKMREAETQELAQQVALVKETDTREMLLERIRQQRAATPKEVEDDQPGYRSEGMQKQFELEQETGRKAVAAEEARQEQQREIWRKQDEEERKRQGTMETVHHPNPGQDEQYPADKATLGKTKK